MEELEETFNSCMYKETRESLFEEDEIFVPSTPLTLTKRTKAKKRLFSVLCEETLTLEEPPQKKSKLGSGKDFVSGKRLQRKPQNRINMTPHMTQVKNYSRTPVIRPVLDTTKMKTMTFPVMKKSFQLPIIERTFCCYGCGTNYNKGPCVDIAMFHNNEVGRSMVGAPHPNALYNFKNRKKGLNSLCSGCVYWKQINDEIMCNDLISREMGKILNQIRVQVFLPTVNGLLNNAKKVIDALCEDVFFLREENTKLRNENKQKTNNFLRTLASKIVKEQRMEMDRIKKNSIKDIKKILKDEKGTHAKRRKSRVIGKLLEFVKEEIKVTSLKENNQKKIEWMIECLDAIMMKMVNVQNFVHPLSYGVSVFLRKFHHPIVMSFINHIGLALSPTKSRTFIEDNAEPLLNKSLPKQEKARHTCADNIGKYNQKTSRSTLDKEKKDERTYSQIVVVDSESVSVKKWNEIANKSKFKSLDDITFEDLKKEKQKEKEFSFIEEKSIKRVYEICQKKLDLIDKAYPNCDIIKEVRTKEESTKEKICPKCETKCPNKYKNCIFCEYKLVNKGQSEIIKKEFKNETLQKIIEKFREIEKEDISTIPLWRKKDERVVTPTQGSRCNPNSYESCEFLIDEIRVRFYRTGQREILIVLDGLPFLRIAVGMIEHPEKYSDIHLGRGLLHYQKKFGSCVYKFLHSINPQIIAKLGFSSLKQIDFMLEMKDIHKGVEGIQTIFESILCELMIQNRENCMKEKKFSEITFQNFRKFIKEKKGEKNFSVQYYAYKITGSFDAFRYGERRGGEVGLTLIRNSTKILSELLFSDNYSVYQKNDSFVRIQNLRRPKELVKEIENAEILPLSKHPTKYGALDHHIEEVNKKSKSICNGGFNFQDWDNTTVLYEDLMEIDEIIREKSNIPDKVRVNRKVTHIIETFLLRGELRYNFFDKNYRITTDVVYDDDEIVKEKFFGDKIEEVLFERKIDFLDFMLESMKENEMPNVEKVFCSPFIFSEYKKKKKKEEKVSAPPKLNDEETINLLESVHGYANLITLCERNEERKNEVRSWKRVILFFLLQTKNKTKNRIRAEEIVEILSKKERSASDNRSLERKKKHFDDRIKD